MKVIIFEGLDNTGKDTIIAKVMEMFDKLYDDKAFIKLVHCKKPTAVTQRGQALQQNFLFKDQIKDLITDYKSKDFDVTIFNRSYLGEYVYGTLYRGRGTTSVKKMIKECEDEMLNEIPQEDITLITLTSSSLNLIQEHDDGLSLSQNIRKNLLSEKKRFEEVTEFSQIENKHLVYVNNDDKYRPLDETVEEIKNYIFSENAEN